MSIFSTMSSTTPLITTIALARQAAIDRFTMPISGIHGLVHWERVRENAAYLCKHSGGDTLVAQLFAYLHDCCRESDGADPFHGSRAAEYVLFLRSRMPQLTDEQFEKLRFACHHHHKGQLSDDPTIGSCWDADRLDLGRVGVYPDPDFLCTETAKQREVIEWAYERSLGKVAAPAEV